MSIRYAVSSIRNEGPDTAVLVLKVNTAAQPFIEGACILSVHPAVAGQYTWVEVMRANANSFAEARVELILYVRQHAQWVLPLLSPNDR